MAEKHPSSIAAGHFAPWSPTLLAIALIAIFLVSPTPLAAAEAKPRVIVLTDISNEPDDEESLVRYLVYANEIDTEGLVATTSTWLKDKTREDLIRKSIDAYAKVRDNLLVHAPGFPSPDDLRGITTTGQPGYGMAFVGTGKSTAGSKLLIDALARDDQRPLWVSVWGGANTLAQALLDLRDSLAKDELARQIAKLRVYSISDQDDAGLWIRREFPDLFYIVSPSTQDGKEYWRATWTGISGDRHYKNGPRSHFELVDNPWLKKHVVDDHGPLGALYPRVAYIMEGDTPAFLGLIDNGLGWSVSPGYGGWGGRYVHYRPSGEPRAIWTNNADSRDTVTLDDGTAHTSDPATIWRWREHFQHDFAARMDWCVADAFEEANHNPRLVVNADRSREVLRMPAPSESILPLSAAGSDDPDGDHVKVSWWIYPEAGTLREQATLSAAEGLTTELRVPKVSRAGSVHLIAQAVDDGEPPLVAYRRLIVEVEP